MKSAHFLVLLLALTTVGGAILCWKQHRELVALRASALNQGDRAELQKRLWDAEKRAKALASELAATQTPPASGSEAIAASDVRAQIPDNVSGRDNRRPAPMMNNMAAFMDNPEMQKLMALQQRGMLDSSYAALFKTLGLNPEQLEKFKDLLVEKQMAMMDVMAATRAQGVNPRSDPDGFRKMIADAQAEIDSSIKATLGETGFSQYQQYQQTFPQRSVVNQLQQSLSYTSTPLNDSQTEQLVQILAQTSPNQTIPGAGNMATAARMPAMVGVGAMTMPFGGGTTINPEAVNLAQGVLSTPQLQALQRLQQQQLAQQQLQQAMRQSQGNRGGSATSTAPRPAPKG